MRGGRARGGAGVSVWSWLPSIFGRESGEWKYVGHWAGPPKFPRRPRELARPGGVQVFREWPLRTKYRYVWTRR